MDFIYWDDGIESQSFLTFPTAAGFYLFKWILNLNKFYINETLPFFLIKSDILSKILID